VSCLLLYRPSFSPLTPPSRPRLELGKCYPVDFQRIVRIDELPGPAPVRRTADGSVVPTHLATPRVCAFVFESVCAFESGQVCVCVCVCVCEFG
jgi:hypothetical protein